MAKKKIFTVGFDLPGADFDYVDFDSDRTLLDADIILFRPTLGEYESDYDQQFNGKEILSHKSSFETKQRLDHWRAEIIAAVDAGRLVIIYLAKPVELCRYTGEQRFSGTGRSRVTTNVVTNISSYEAVPNVESVKSKSGSEIRLEKDASYLVPYWKDFSACSPYEVEIEGKFTRVLLSSRVGDRTVGAAFHGKRGVLLFLPPLQYDEDSFIRDAEGDEDNAKQYWTDEALQFAKRLVANLVALADSLSQTTRTTPAPEWTLFNEYRLDAEGELEAGISACAAEIAGLQAKRSELIKHLDAAGTLRRLLFEQGKPLEGAVLEAMTLLGFDAQSFSDGDSEFDGIFVSPEGRCLGEVEGKDSKAINIDKFSQLERNLQEDFARNEVTEYAKGVLFGNAYRLTPPNERGQFFTDKCISAAKRVGAALIRTPDLFAPAKYLRFQTDAVYAAKCRGAIFGASGHVVSFPPPPTIEASSIAAIEDGISAAGANL